VGLGRWLALESDMREQPVVKLGFGIQCPKALCEGMP
jgi:hypothetical protein